MKAIHYFLFSLALFASCTSLAQQDTLRINPLALDSLPTTTFTLGGSDTANNPSFGIWLYNVRDTTFSSDSVSFAYAIGTGGAYITYQANGIDTLSGCSFNPQFVTIGPHDSILLSSLQLHISAPDFVIGSSVVVIWPVIYGNAALVVLDSASTQLTIVPPSGIGNIDAGDVKVYMSGQMLFVKNNSQNSFGDIRIHNMIGELITQQRISQSAEIPMSQYAGGIYMVELTLDNGQRAVYKVSNVMVH